MMRAVLKAAIARRQGAGREDRRRLRHELRPAERHPLAREVVMLVEAGLTPLEALQAATTRNAELLQRERQIGQVAPDSRPISSWSAAIPFRMSGRCWTR